MVKEEHIRRANIEDAQTLSDLSKVTFFDTFKDTCTAEDMQGFISEYFNIELIKKELLSGYHKKADTMFAALFKK